MKENKNIRTAPRLDAKTAEQETILWRERALHMIRDVAKWGERCPAIDSIILAGSFARGEERQDSDLDFCILTGDKDRMVQEQEFAAQFGMIKKKQTEYYGACTSVRVWYQEGIEAEFGFVKPDWISLPLDPGTERVLQDGYLVLTDKRGLFEHPDLPKRRILSDTKEQEETE